MKSILFLAYYYPPVNNAGTQRIEKFAKYLPGFDFKPIILTTFHSFNPYLQVKNFRLSRKHPKEEKGEGLVYRAAELRDLVRSRGEGIEDFSGYSEDNSNSLKRKIKNFLKAWFFIPDSKITWLPFAFLKALWITKKHKVEYVVSSFPPASSHLLGLLLSKCTYVKWIADFRDGWCFDPLDPALTHSPARLFLDRILEKIVIKNCDQILVTSPLVEDYFKESNKVKLLTNGFDQDDFDDAKKGLDRFKNFQQFFVISHAGAFHLSHPGNTPAYFLKALKRAFSKHPEMEAQTKVFFLGNLTKEERRLPYKLGLKKTVKILGLRPHKEAIQYRLISDVLLLVDRKTKTHSSYIHGKLFEHLASRKTILALLPEKSAARSFLEKLGVGEIIRPEDVDRIAEKIWQLFSEWQKGGILRYELTDEELASFERKTLTKELAGVLNSI